MSKISETAVFFGSGPVAAASLRKLREHAPIEAVITKATTQVEMQATAPDIPVYIVHSRQELDACIAKEQLSSAYGIVIDFGIIVSQATIDHFPQGILNSHFSLLPEWRGADPISFAILSGQSVTGVSLMQLSAGLDEGNIVAQGECTISRTDTTPSLTQKLIHLSDALLADVLPQYLSGAIQPVTQEQAAAALGRSSEPTYSRKLTKADGIMRWTKSAVELEREVRAFTGWPRSRTTIGLKEIVITRAHVHSNTSTRLPGAIDIGLDKRTIHVHTGAGILAIDQLQPAGKAEMSAQSFLNGYQSLLLQHPIAGD